MFGESAILFALSHEKHLLFRYSVYRSYVLYDELVSPQAHCESVDWYIYIYIYLYVGLSKEWWGKWVGFVSAQHKQIKIIWQTRYRYHSYDGNTNDEITKYIYIYFLNPQNSLWSNQGSRTPFNTINICKHDSRIHIYTKRSNYRRTKIKAQPR